MFATFVPTKFFQQNCFVITCLFCKPLGPYTGPFLKTCIQKKRGKNTKEHVFLHPFTGDLANVWPRVVPQDKALPTMNSHHRKMKKWLYHLEYFLLEFFLIGYNALGGILFEVMGETSRNYFYDENSFCNPAMLFKHHCHGE